MNNLPKKIVCIGASSCEGKVDIEGQGFVGRLRRYHEAFNQHNSVYNLGISGDVAENMVRRLLVEAPPRKPDLIIIQCGVNDFIRSPEKTSPTRYTPEQVEANVTRLVEEVLKMAPVILVSVYPINEEKTTPCSWRPINYLLEDAKLHAEITKRVAAQKSIPYVDVFGSWIEEDYKKYLYEDGLHAASAGHQKIFEMLKEKLMELYP